MISSCCSVVTVLFTRLSTQVRFVFLFLVPPWRREGQNPWDSLSVQHESNLVYTRRHWGSLSAFFVKVPPKKWFSINCRRAKIWSESIDCSNGYDLKNWLTAGAAVDIQTFAKYCAQIYRAQYGAAIMVYLCGTPAWRPQNSAFIFILLWLSKQLIVCTEENDDVTCKPRILIEGIPI